MTDERTETAAGTLAAALLAWLAGDVHSAPRSIERVLDGTHVHLARPLLRQTRRRCHYYMPAVGLPAALIQAISATPPPLVEGCLLAAAAHPNGYLREAVARQLRGRTSAYAAAAAVVLADDHVQPIRTLGMALVDELLPARLALFPHHLTERWRGGDRLAWRRRALARLRSPAGRAALNHCAQTGPDDVVMHAVELLQRMGALDHETAAAMQRSISWRVRARMAEVAVQHGWEDLVDIAMEDPERFVRRTLVDAAARRQDALRERIMRQMLRDSTGGIRRVASWYMADDEGCRAWCIEELRSPSRKRVRLALIGAAEVCPEDARSTAARLLQSASAADRCAAILALAQTGGLSEEHVQTLMLEPSARVRQVTRGALKRAFDEETQGRLDRAWAG